MDSRNHVIVRIGMALLLTFPILMLAGCGGGSSGTGSSGPTVNVSLASTVPNAVPVFAGNFAPTQTSSAPSAPATNDIGHVWVTVYRVSLIPGNSSPGPDPNGEMSVQDMSPPNAAGHISADLAKPEEIDLLDLPAAGLALAKFLNAIPSVPAGTYGKIRLYYTDPKVQRGAADNTTMHGTANFHLDIHFKGEKLVIPEATGGGVNLFEVTVVFVLGKDGLKITAGPNNILMRPQVFATVSEIRYVLTGTVDNVDKVESTFNLATEDEDGRIFDVAYDPSDTNWSFRESGTNPRTVAIDNEAFAIAALNDGATASVIGAFSVGVFLADDITITFPVPQTGIVASGTPASGWLANDTFVLALPTDNVIPMPSRFGARYDNNADLSLLAIGQAAIVQGAVVTARGYAVPGGTEAYWISVGP